MNERREKKKGEKKGEDAKERNDPEGIAMNLSVEGIDRAIGELTRYVNRDRASRYRGLGKRERERKCARALKRAVGRYTVRRLGSKEKRTTRINAFVGEK